MSFLSYLSQAAHLDPVQEDRVTYVIAKPEWTAQDEALVKELSTMPHFGALEKLVTLRAADLNEEHLKTSDKQYAVRIDEDRTILSLVRSRSLPRAKPDDEPA